MKNNEIISYERLESLKKVFRQCEHSSERQAKSIAIELGMGFGQWSRTKSLQAHFPIWKMRDFIRVCKSDALLRWVADDCGYELVRKKGCEERLEEKARKLKEAIDTLARHVNALDKGR